MKKSTLISLAALAVAVIGVLIALAAYFKKKHDTVVDDFEDELYYDDLEEDAEYYEADLEDECCEDCACCCQECCEEECCECGCGCCEEAEKEEPQA